MLKKFISALASVSLLITATAFSTNDIQNADNGLNIDKSASNNANDAAVKGNNSIGKYIEKMSLQEEKDGIQPLNLKASADEYKVAGIDFDLSTRKLTAITTQSKACTLKIEFINDDNAQDIYEMKAPVGVGERSETVLTVDTAVLPEFFEVRAVLVDNYGNELSERYILSKYMRFMQELAVATVDDYDEQYVVNLDESEETNFFVLNEDTIVAESSEKENTLVSADYDNEVYVFENINDSIRYLSEGDYFYAQPNDMDMVAVNIESIEIDGDTATIRGGGDIDDMFDVIKLDVDPESIDLSELENDNELENYASITSNGEKIEDYSVEYNGTVMDDSGDYEIDYSVVNYDSINTPRALGDDSTITAVEIPLEFEFKPHKTAIGEPDNKYSKKISDTQFTNKTTSSYELSAEVTAKLTLKLGIDLTFRKKKKDSDFGVDTSFKAGVKVEGTAKAEWSFALDAIPPVNVLGIFFLDLEPCIKIGVEGSINVQQEMVFTFTLHSIKKDGKRTLIHDHDFSKGINNATNTFEIEGDFYIEFVPKVLIYPFACKKLLFCSFSVPVKFNAKVSLFKAENNSSDLQSGTFSSDLVNTKENAIHICLSCYRIEPSVSFNIESELKVPFCEKQKIKFFKKEWKLSPWHHSETFMETKKGECEHYAYATDLHVIGTEDINAEGLVVEVDGIKTTTNAYGDARFYLVPNKTHSYKVYSNDKSIRSDSFSIKEEYSTFDIDLNDGSTKKAGSTPITTTAAYTEPPEPHTVTSAIATIRESEPDDIIVEGGPLGDNVFYSLYPDGLLYIFGYGPMNTSNNPIKNKALVKNVLFEDQATFLKDEIENESTNEILIEEFTEKNQKELCEKYLKNNKDEIIKVLNEEYYVEVNDPNLDEMINDYISVNSEKIARKYFDEHESEYADALAKFKKSLLTDASDKVITSIGNGLFKNCTNLKSITYEGSPNEGKVAVELPPSITKIGNNAFEDCRSLPFGDFKLHDGVTSIGGNAFQECHGMISCTIPNSVESMGGSLFRWCLNLEKVSLPFAGATKDSKKGTIIDLLFGIAPRGEVMIKPDEYYEYQDKFISHQYIPYGPDYDPPSLTAPVWRDCDLPKNFKEIAITGGYQIPENAFAFCTFLEKLTLPDTIESIGVYAFYDCNKVKELNLTDNLKNIGNKAFMQCSSLEKIILSENITTIGYSAFVQTGEAKVYIPEKIDNIPDNAFNTSAPNTIYGYKGSFAEKYANNKKIKFVAYGSDDFSIERTTTTTTTTTTTVTTTTTTTVPTPTKTTTTSSGTPAEGVRGDANGDGELDMSDAVLIMQALANPNKYGVNGTSPTHITAAGFKYADTDGNGLTVNDALRIQKFLLGLIKSFDE